jgi:hypothetical protein
MCTKVDHTFNEKAALSCRKYFIIPKQRTSSRHDLLEQIRQALYETKTIKYNHCLTIYGMNGVGTTQSAVKYIHRFEDYY